LGGVSLSFESLQNINIFMKFNQNLNVKEEGRRANFGGVVRYKTPTLILIQLSKVPIFFWNFFYRTSIAEGL